jgi:hypothetical protein
LDYRIHIIGIISLCHILFGFFCAWSMDNTLYKSKSDNSSIIFCRTFDCYGTTDACRLYKVKKLTNHIKWISTVEEKIVDSTLWDKVPFNPEIFNPYLKEGFGN